MGLVRTIRNALIVSTAHAFTVGLVSKILYPVGFFATSIFGSLLVGTWNLHWLLGLSVTGVLAAGTWTGIDYIISNSVLQRDIEELKRLLPDNAILYIVTGLGIPLTIALVSPMLGAISALFLGPLSLPHFKDFQFNVRKEEGANSLILDFVKSKQSDLERKAAPYLKPHTALQSLIGPDLSDDPNDRDFADHSAYESSYEESEIEEDVAQNLGTMAMDASQKVIVNSAHASVFENIPFFGRYLKERPSERTVNPVANPKDSFDAGGYTLRKRPPNDLRIQMPSATR